MACVVLVTTMSFTVDMHYCGDTLVDFSFIQSAKTCGMEKVQTSKGCEKPMLSEKSCCSDEQIIKEGKDDLKISFDTLFRISNVYLHVYNGIYVISIST